MCRLTSVWTLAATVVLAFWGVGAAPCAAATSKEVEQSIEKARKLLLAVQKDGNWEAVPRRKADGDLLEGSQWGGPTALITYALLAAGQSPQDPQMVKAAEFLRNADMIGTYAVGMRAQVWRYFPRRKEFQDALKRDRDILLANMRKAPEMRGMYRYTADEHDGYDHSASQYAVLGMWACEQAGAEAPKDYWKTVEAAWIRTQDRSGGWTYSTMSPDSKVTPAMAAAGIATLFITQDYLHAREGVECKGNVSNKAIEAGMRWMRDNFEKSFNAEWQFYTLYGIERVGVASGHKYFGTHDWYKRGADALVKWQQGNGGWNGNAVDTALAMLFLVRGRAPVVMNKLEYRFDVRGDKSIEAHWNERPRDAANVTRWIGHQFEREFNWQIVNLEGSIDDLHDAPILYLAGNQVLNLPAADERKLKEFVEQGGLILANADCGHLGFATSFKKLGTKLFNGYEFRELPAGHVLYNNLFPRTKWRTPISVQGLSNGARELMILIPTADPARFWQTGAVGGNEALHQFMANLFLYTSEVRDFRFKGETSIVRPDPVVQNTRTLKVARLEHAGNWNPEPGGWRRLAAVMQNDAQVKLEVESMKLGAGKLAPGAFQVAHLTSTNKFKLADAQRAELKAFIAGGGMLLADSCGGDVDAAGAIEAELTALGLGNATVIPPDHALYGKLGIPVEQLAWRFYATKVHVGKLKGPRLRGIEVNNRLAVFYSSEDLSVGLVGQTIDGVVGYKPDSATAIVKAILLNTAK